MERPEGVVRRWPSRIANVMLKHVVDLPIHDFGTTFRAYRADLVQRLRLFGDQHRFVPALAWLIGARVTEVAIRSIERPFGTSNYGLGRTLGVFLDIVFLWFYRYCVARPLKALGIVALFLLGATAALSMSLLGYSMVTGASILGDHLAWVLVAVLMLLASFQVLLTGLLAELLVQIHSRTSQADHFIVRQEWNAENISCLAGQS